MKKTLFAILLLAGCGGGGGNERPLEVEATPNHPANGTVLETTCNGTTLIETIADGNGGSTQQQIRNSTQCGYIEPTLPAEGTLYGESYCAVELENDPDYLDIVSEEINHLLREDRLQDYHDGNGGYYTERLVHIDQTCFVQMSQPDDCPTTASDTGDSRYEYLTCDGVKQRSNVDFPYDPEQYETAVIDILIVFDTNITEEDRDGMTIEEFVDKQIFNANHMYISSGTKTLFRLAGIKLVEVAPGDLYRQYAAFFNGRYEFYGLDDWQFEAEADIAFLFKKKPENAIACGVANLDATRGIDKSRGITQCFHNTTFQSTATTRYYARAHETFAHELGHLLGAQHEFEDANTPGIFEYSFGYNLPGPNPQIDNPVYEGIYGGYGTIMTYADLPTGRFSDYDTNCIFPDDEQAGEYAGQSVTMGTRGGCFCMDPIEEQPPPTNNVETIERTRYIMSQLHELDHNLQSQFSPSAMYIDGLLLDNGTISDEIEICLF